MMTFYLAVTGGIASGKSTADSYFKEQGLQIIDSDEIAHNLLEKDTEVTKRIAQSFGKECLLSNGGVNRKRLGKIVFNDSEKLTLLNQITHPAILAEIEKKKAVIKSGVCIVDVPLLFESNQQKYYDASLLIYVPEKVQLERLMRRNKLSKEDAMARIKSQMSTSKKLKLATYSVANTGTIEVLQDKLSKILQEVKEKEDAMSKLS